MKTAILTTVFNRQGSFLNFIESLNAQSFKDFDLIVVDHGTKSLQIPLEAPFKIIHLKRSSDLWFSGATNEGFRYVLSQPEYDKIIFANDDIEMLGSNFLMNLYNSIDDTHVVGCAAINSEDKIIYAGLRFRPLKFAFEKQEAGLKINHIKIEDILCDALPTRCIGFTRRTLERTGLLAENKLPQYASDFEWTIRAKKKGLKLIMKRDLLIRTKIKPTSEYASGRNFYPKSKLSSFYRDFFNPYRQGNFYDLRNFASLVFPAPYRYLYILIHLLRRCGGFLYTNYFLRRSYIP